MRNLRLASRTLLKTPVVTSVAVVSLALGIGANAAIFSLFNQILLRPLPVAEPERLVNLEAPGPKPGSDNCNQAGGCDEVFSYPMFRDLQRDQEVFTDIAAHRTFGLNVTYEGQTISGQGVEVSGSYFPALRLIPALGQLLGPEVDEPIGGHPLVVVSHDFWQSRLDADPDVIGDAILVNGQPMTITGVAPAGFRGTTLGSRPMIFVPITMRGVLSAIWSGTATFEDRRSYWVYLFARLRPEVSIEQARAGLEPLYRSLLSEVEAPLQVNMSEQTMARFLSKPIPIEDGRRGQSSMDEEAGAPLLLLFGVTVIVLLIACANIANLLLAKSAVRAPEMAVRLSIGASRRHLLTQLLTESCLLALVGGVVGLVVARWTLSLIGGMMPPDDAGTLTLALDPFMVLFTMAVSLLTGMLFGVFPALHSTRSDLVSTLKDEAGQPAGARAAARFRTGLVVAQFALSMTLLVSAGLFIQSLRNVSRVDLGMRTENVVMFSLEPSLNGYETPRIRALFDRVEAELAAQPGVTGVSAATVAVFGGSSWGNNVMVEGFEAGPDTDRNSRFNQIGTEYFRTLEVPLVAGREFVASDVVETSKVAIVNESFARKFGLGRDVVGKRMGRGGLDAELDMEIVGLVSDMKYNDVKNPRQPLFFAPYRQEDTGGPMTFYARTSASPDGILRTIPTLIARLDPNLSVDNLKTLPQQVRENVVLDRLIGTLSAAFAVLATLLAAVGLYGVLAYTVAQRTREIGLRAALGADASCLRNMVLGQVGRMTLAGGALGVAAAIGLGRLAQSLLYEIEGTSPVVVGAAVLALGAVALAAGFVPAHRASRINPMIALRYK
jgi:predicted permease